MLTLIIILTAFVAISAFCIIKKPVASDVKTTSEDVKAAGWMDLGGDPNANKYTSKVNESLQENDAKAKKSKKK